MNESQKKTISLKTLNKEKSVRFNEDTELIEIQKSSSTLRSVHNMNKFRSIAHTSELKGRVKHKKYYTEREFGVEDKSMKQALEQIQPRGSTFFKLGFTNEEKKGKNRKVFGEFFNLQYEDMKGTMTTGELWSNKDRSNFLKENKIYINKVKLIEKITSFRRDFDRSAKKISNQKSTSSFSSLNTLSNFGSIHSIYSIKENQTMSKKKAVNNLNAIRKNLAELHEGNKQSRLEVLIKDMECHAENMSKMEQKYFVKLIEML